jgi:hypothetical protein
MSVAAVCCAEGFTPNAFAGCTQLSRRCTLPHSNCNSSALLERRATCREESELRGSVLGLPRRAGQRMVPFCAGGTRSVGLILLYL